MSQRMTRSEFVDQLGSQLSSWAEANPSHTVLKGVRWQPLDGFPTVVHKFDVVVLHAHAQLVVRDDGVMTSRHSAPVVAIDVVSAENLESVLYERLDLPNFAAMYEYAILDPTGELLRPSFQAFRRHDAGCQPVRTAYHGVFFSAAGFRLDVTTERPEVRSCGRSWKEEEKFLAMLPPLRGNS